MDSARRDFLKKALALGAGVMLNPFSRVAGAATGKAIATGVTVEEAQKSLKGFIVSDAHFGWTGADQPTVETQRQMMKIITDRFPDLDVFLDTGDAHHGGNVPDSARGDWTDVIQGGCGTSPFYYVMGNHEQKVENRCNTFGSNECRPYYSFNLLGIHFVSLPEVMDHSYISEAEKAWLRLDLQLHKNMTTLAFSHNSLKGTTEYFNDRGYRQLTNSDAILELFQQYPNVIGWMHGHNHTYEIVPKEGSIYVSNGRIGGFDPKNYAGNRNGTKYGSGHLGGIYFEVTGDGLLVRCFSATRNLFLDELPSGEVFIHNLQRRTSFDPKAEAAYCCGFGGSPSGQQLKAWRHHMGGERTLYLTGSENPVINENQDFKVYVQRTSNKYMQKILSGYAMWPNEEDQDKVDSSWEWTDPGIRILRREKPHEEKGVFAPNNNFSYFLCSPGETYTLSVAVSSTVGGHTAQAVCRFYGGDNAEMLHEYNAPAVTLMGGMQEFSWDFTPPSAVDLRSKKGTTFEENEIRMCVGVLFSNIVRDVDVLSFRLRLANAAPGAGSIDPTISVDSQKVSYEGALVQGEVRNFQLAASADAESVYGVRVKGSGRVTWLEKRSAPKYQVRNAAGYFADGLYVVGPMRNPFSDRQEIVLSPMVRTTLPYLHRTRNVDVFALREATPGNMRIEVRVKAFIPGVRQAEMDFISPIPPKKVTGTDTYRYVGNTLTVIGKFDKISIQW